MGNTTRAEHLEFCKARALEYLEQGDIANAYASFASDMRKHEETKGPILMLGDQLFYSGHLSTPQKMREWINGFR